MQPTEGFNVQRRTLDVEDYIDILRRHKGWIFGPFLFVLVGSVVGVYLWPDSYESQAVVQIVPQRVPQSMVQSAVNQDMTDRINTMANTILSRVALTTIIRNFDLYKREQNRMPIEDVIEQMRQDIGIQGVQTIAGPGSVPAFAVTFKYEDRLAAQRVVQELVTRFIDENVRERNSTTYETQQFLQDQTDMARRALEETENHLTQFRVANNGRLPDQLAGNMQQLNALQQQGYNLLNAVTRLQNEKSSLQTNINIRKDEIQALQKESTTVAREATKSQRLSEVDREIDQWDRSIADLLRQYKETYPDVKMARDHLEVAKRRRQTILDEEAAAAAARQDDSPPPLSADTQRQIREYQAQIQQIESSIQTNDSQIESMNRQLKQNNEDISRFQSRIQAVPVGEQEYSDLLREESLARDKYVQMNEKLGRAQVAYDMEGRKQGETLALLDPPSLPTNPTAPKRGLVVSVGAALGLLLGVVIVGAREVKDTSLKNLKDVRAYTQMAILGSVPLLENDFVVRRRKRIAWLGWTTACLAAAVAIAGSIVYYYASKG